MYPEVSAARGLAIAQVNNDALAASCAQYPARFLPLASVPLQDPPAAARELERAAQLGLRGVEIPPHVQGQGLDEPPFAVFWDAAEALGMVVCIHPFEAAPQGMLARYNLGNLVGNLYDTGLAAALLIYGGVLERHPALRVVLYHDGGALPSLLGRLDMGYRMSPECRTAIPRPPWSWGADIVLEHALGADGQPSSAVGLPEDLGERYRYPSQAGGCGRLALACCGSAA